MKIINGILTLLFILFAAVQFNDPDPIVWVIIYTAVAAISGFAVAGKYNKNVIVTVIGICIIWMLTLVPGVVDWVEQGMPSITGSMKAESPYIEYLREFLGLFIALLALVFHYFQARKKSKIV
jgi:Transmembrane family 220, helix